MRESQDLAVVLDEHRGGRGVLVYAEDTHTYAQYEGYLRALKESHGVSVTYVTSDPADPVLRRPTYGMRALHLGRQVPELFRRIEAGATVLTMPDLGNFHVPKPERSTCLYAFHSLNSVHTSYREGAFDHYDVFLCTGPHHVRELSAVFTQRGLPLPELREVGYSKLDRIAETHRAFRKADPTQTTVVVAPSWAPGNILEAHGKDVVRSLVAMGFRVVVRPHPQFFHTLYPKGRAIVSGLQEDFEGHQQVLFELSIDDEDSFHEADLMVSDWSGAAFEYALGTLRPVLFLDTAQKLSNPSWMSVGMAAFEDVMRDKVGQVVPCSAVGSIGDLAAALLSDLDGFRQMLNELRADAVFNFGRSAEAGAAVVRETLGH